MAFLYPQADPLFLVTSKVHNQTVRHQQGNPAITARGASTPPLIAWETNMTVLITYDLNKEAKRPPIVDAIKSIGNGWARLSESSYAITTTLSPQQVFQRLSPLLDSNDSLYVITLSRPWWGQGKSEVSEWLQKNI